MSSRHWKHPIAALRCLLTVFDQQIPWPRCAMGNATQFDGGTWENQKRGNVKRNNVDPNVQRLKVTQSVVNSMGLLPGITLCHIDIVL